LSFDRLVAVLLGRARRADLRVAAIDVVDERLGLGLAVALPALGVRLLEDRIEALEEEQGVELGLERLLGLLAAVGAVHVDAAVVGGDLDVERADRDAQPLDGVAAEAAQALGEGVHLLAGAAEGAHEHAGVVGDLEVAELLPVLVDQIGLQAEDELTEVGARADQELGLHVVARVGRGLEVDRGVGRELAHHDPEDGQRAQDRHQRDALLPALPHRPFFRRNHRFLSRLSW